MGNDAEVVLVHITAKTGLQSKSCFSEQVVAAVNGCGESVWNHRIIKVGNDLQDHQLPTVNLAPPRPPVNNVPKSHMHPFFEHFQVTLLHPWMPCSSA